MRTILLGVTLALLLGGCGFLLKKHPATRIDQGQEFMDVARSTYNERMALVVREAPKPPRRPDGPLVYFTGGGNAVWIDSSFARLIDDDVFYAIMAHEFSHWLLRHLTPSVDGELAANAKGVEVLMRVKQLDEATAVGWMLAYLDVVRVRNTNYAALVHPEPCVEVRALLSEFPAQREAFATHPCALALAR
jgi:hypothetical protein